VHVGVYVCRQWSELSRPLLPHGAPVRAAVTPSCHLVAQEHTDDTRVWEIGVGGLVCVVGGWDGSGCIPSSGCCIYIYMTKHVGVFFLYIFISLYIYIYIDRGI